MTTKYLPAFELTLYISTYIALVAYGTWQLHLFSNVIHMYSDPSDFRPGWLPQWPHENDTEWTTWTGYFGRNWPWFVGHMLVAELTPRLAAPSTAVARYVSAAYGVLFIVHGYGASLAAGFVLNIFVFLRVASFGRRSYVWLLAVAWLCLLNALKWLPFMDNLVRRGILTDATVWELYTIGAWSCLRLLSACLDWTDQTGIEPSRRAHVADVVAYVLYVPTFFYGPIVLFGRYMQMVSDQQQLDLRPPLRERLLRLGSQLGRIGVQVVAIELGAHVLYVNALQANVELCERVPLTALYAFGFMMGTLFYLKYQVAYGGSLALAQFAGMRTPNLPKFIGRVHLYSDMWKWFDHGLYEFLFRHIYAALCTRLSTLRRRLAGSAVTFAFIFLFHGTFDYVLVWSVLNYACTTLEAMARSLIAAKRPTIGRHLSERNQRRLLAVAGSQLFIPAVLANFYFFAGYDVGGVFVRRTYLESGWWQYAVLTGCAVCIFHTSELLKRSEQSASKTASGRPAT